MGGVVDLVGVAAIAADLDIAESCLLRWMARHCCVVAGQGTLVRPRGSWVRRRRPAR